MKNQSTKTINHFKICMYLIIFGFKCIKLKLTEVGEIHKHLIVTKDTMTLLLLTDSRIRDIAATNLGVLNMVNRISIIDIHILLHSELHNKYCFL